MNKPSAPTKSTAAPLKEGEDFYFNKDGLMVLTEAYHLRRGYCCHSGCTHCPYDTKDINPDIPMELQQPEDNPYSDYQFFEELDEDL